MKLNEMKNEETKRKMKFFSQNHGYFWLSIASNHERPSASQRHMQMTH